MLYKVGLTVRQVISGTDMEETSDFKIRKLIALVKENSILLDVSMDDYKLAERKPQIWKDIADELAIDKMTAIIAVNYCNYDCLTSSVFRHLNANSVYAISWFFA
jgi:hypothetical protein